MSDTPDPEALAAQVPAAIAADRFYFEVRGGLCRIAFGEGGPDGVTYRQAAAMTPENAIALAELILRFVQRAPGDEPPPVGGAGLH